MKHLPFKDNIFNLIICDPPHMRVGLGSWLEKKWGNWTQSDVIRTMKICNDEFVRVLTSNGFLILKVMPRDFPIYETLLKNFVFFLPIPTERSRGCFSKPLPKRKGALWSIGRSKET